MNKQVEQIHEELDNLLNSCGVHTEHIHRDFLYVVARHFANWQKQKSMQDFLEKACKWLEKNSESYVRFDEVGYRFYAHSSLIKDFKNYIENESKD